MSLVYIRKCIAWPVNTESHTVIEDPGYCLCVADYEFTGTDLTTNIDVCCVSSGQIWNILLVILHTHCVLWICLQPSTGTIHPNHCHWNVGFSRYSENNMYYYSQCSPGKYKGVKGNVSCIDCPLTSSYLGFVSVRTIKGRSLTHSTSSSMVWEFNVG